MGPTIYRRIVYLGAMELSAKSYLAIASAMWSVITLWCMHMMRSGPRPALRLLPLAIDREDVCVTDI